MQRNAARPHLGWRQGPFRRGLNTAKARREAIAHSQVGRRRRLSLHGAPLTFTASFDLQSVAVHMHKLGTGATLWLSKPGQPQKVLLNVTNYDFNWQTTYVFATPVKFDPGDMLTLRCSYDNVPERWADGVSKTVHWGEGTEDEMCLATLLSSQPN